MAGNVVQEEQEIRLYSSVYKEKQAITFENFTEQTMVYEEQDVFVESVGQGSFRLGLYSVYTGKEYSKI